jgi:hypothetical protein
LADDAYGATIAKRILSRHLAGFRASTGYAANHVCDHLGWGRGRLGKIESNRWVSPDSEEVRALLELYGVTGTNRDEVEELALLAGARAWWRDFPDVFENEFPGYENDAVTIRVSAPLVLPTLLQTRAYAESMLRTECRPPAWRCKALDACLRRQEVLDGPHAITLSVIVTEASLRYRWGTSNDRGEQIDHLIYMAGKSNVRLRVQRFVDGLPVGANAAISIFGFDGANPDMVFVENGCFVEEVASRELADGHVQSFYESCERALDPDDTLHYLKRLAKDRYFGSQQVIISSSRYLEARKPIAARILMDKEGAREGIDVQKGAVDAGPAPANERISVAVYVDGNSYAMRQVLGRVDELVHALGYGDPFAEEIERGSIFRKYFALIKRGISSSEVQERAIKAERALELLTIDGRQAQVDGQVAAAVQNLVSSLSEVPKACVRVGSILLIKYSDNDGALVVVRTLSQVEIKAFEKFPEIQRVPEKTLEALAFALTQDESSPASNL